jgi:hypothetical protein
MDGMIQNMELAARMQLTTPEIVDISKESEAALDLCGVDSKDTNSFERACLLARKFSEAGARFVQVNTGGWDHHGDIRGNLPKLCAQTDPPVAALIKDLKARGLLEDTLVRLRVFIDTWDDLTRRMRCVNAFSGHLRVAGVASGESAAALMHGRVEQCRSGAGFLRRNEANGCHQSKGLALAVFPRQARLL